jgi:hypothetical protein
MELARSPAKEELNVAALLLMAEWLSRCGEDLRFDTMQSGRYIPRPSS